MHRFIHDLTWAERVKKPKFSPQARATGIKAVGLRFEKKVAEGIPGAQRGKWFRFRDANGEGWCSPDIILPVNFGLLCLECKLSDLPEAKTQISRLYKPVLELVYGRPVFGIVVTRHLRPFTDPADVVDSLRDAILRLRDAPTCIPILHWLGRSGAHLRLEP